MTAPLAPPDIRRTCTTATARLHEKLAPARMASSALALPRPLVFTNGVFDILHRGHVTYLAAARALGASLVVGINSDDSVRRLGKGANRPINPQADRALVIAALTSVDAVLLFAEDTPCELIVGIHPDIYVKGGDYDIDALPETQIVRGWGGQAYALPFEDGYSTTALIARTRTAPC